jgi:hypothetical protein
MRGTILSRHIYASMVLCLRSGTTLNYYCYYLLICLDSLFGIALDYGLDDRGSRFRFPTGALSPTQWVPGAFSLGIKW